MSRNATAASIDNDRSGNPGRRHDAHRPLRNDEDLSHIFSWQEEAAFGQAVAMMLLNAFKTGPRNCRPTQLLSVIPLSIAVRLQMKHNCMRSPYGG